MKEFIQKLGSYSFWFDIDRGMYHKIDFAILCFGALLLLAAIAVHIALLRGVHSKATNPLKRVRSVLFWIGIIEVVWFAFRWQFIPFFGTHFVAGVVLIVGAIWYGYAMKYFVKQYRTDKTALEKEQQKLKYMPDYKP
ncbi:MAG TPA: hypothetical protein VEA59_07055 [Patescibacteria group bacterium]|nr:hypothetical protein [Patescibacteria group bacterium]